MFFPGVGTGALLFFWPQKHDELVPKISNRWCSTNLLGFTARLAALLVSPETGVISAYELQQALAIIAKQKHKLDLAPQFGDYGTIC